MKYTSALFLVLLIAPIAFAESDVIEMIQKTDEGKEVLDQVFLETGLYGSRLNVAAVTGRLRTIASTAREIRSTFNRARTQNNKVCRQDVKALTSRYNDFVLRNSLARTQLTGAGKISIRNRALIARAQQELGHSKRFQTMSEENSNAWKRFWATSIKNVKNIANLIARLRTHVSQLHRRNRRTAFVELPPSFNDALTQISAEFEKEFDNLNGYRPIIANLLEIVRSPVHLRRKATRVSVRRILGRLAEKFHDDVNTFAEENEHQRVFFHGISTLYADRASRINNSISGLVSAQKNINAKVRWLTESVRGTEQLVRDAANITDLRKQECSNVNYMVNVNTVRLTRVLRSVSQVLEVISDRFGDFKKAVKGRGKK